MKKILPVLVFLLASNSFALGITCNLSIGEPGENWGKIFILNVINRQDGSAYINGQYEGPCFIDADFYKDGRNDIDINCGYLGNARVDIAFSKYDKLEIEFKYDDSKSIYKRIRFVNFNCRKVN